MARQSAERRRGSRVEERGLKEVYDATKQEYQQKQISRWWLVLWTALFLLLIEIGVQMLYPNDLARFYTYVDGLDVSQKTNVEITQLLLSDYENQKVIIENPTGEQIEFSIAELGASINVNTQVSAASGYSLALRFVPFSLFWPHNLNIYPDVELSIETNLARKEPVNADIIVGNGQLKVIEAQPGLMVNGENVGDTGVCSNELLLRINQQSVLYCDIAILQPAISTDVAEAVVDKIESTLSDGLVFNYQDKQEVEAGFYDVIKWLSFSPNTEDGIIDTVVDIDKVRSFLEKTKLAKLNQSAESGKIELVNGEVVTRSDGKAGWGIDYQAIVDAISKVINEVADNVVTVELAHIYPGTVYDRVFTDSFKGLSAELEYLYGDKNVAIVTLDLTDRGRNIYVNQWKQFTAASTYKLYVAYSMLRSNSPPWCFETMIIDSDNACPRTWLESKGLKNVENEIHAIGASAVTYFEDFDMRTSAMDLANFLSRIYRKELPVDNDRLINAMKIQRFRQGIPAGLGSNAVVADKVGFLWGLLHDAGIIYSKKGDYIQVILTDGYSWETIAEIASKIYDRM